MLFLKSFLYGFFHKVAALTLSLGLFKGLDKLGLLSGLKGEFYYIPALILILIMVVVFSKYLYEMNRRNVLILLGSLGLGVAILALP